MDRNTRFILIPLGSITGTVVCLDWSQGMDSPVYPFLVVTGLGLGAIVLLCILLIAYGYYTPVPQQPGTHPAGLL